MFDRNKWYWNKMHTDPEFYQRRRETMARAQAAYWRRKHPKSEIELGKSNEQNKRVAGKSTKRG